MESNAAAEKTARVKGAREALNQTIDAYVNQRDPKGLEKALSLIVKNLDHYRNDLAFLDRATDVLVMIKDNPEAAKLATDLARRMVEADPDNPKSYSNAAYTFWRMGDLASAIEVSELGLRKLDPAAEATVILEGNLAYYYAERQFAADADRAKALAREAYARVKTASFADTLGYVLLRFGNSREELEEAYRYLIEAKNVLEKSGGVNPYLQEHIATASRRLEQSA